ncbi:hypothetical protein DICPUDRAFT_149317 [Dictyostelium purpureum]|uniref:Uncharacterized protein n=1 Tax=Dictyostelium purpureum TaxID=5786 RepID=F0ZDD7_DICPU|nr:uncharacterized protein DICPUDRAFT_149317 [Dictyostelium purpureum]EGC38024.1 hypothetical protein DICPUDRAFT_149317 [Dictyostelium purpureum]|eukprot:XP_003285425.1 hypothetical protein DICPUDRAFT_149317 [Dictyostelium purpureum]
MAISLEPLPQYQIHLLQTKNQTIETIIFTEGIPYEGGYVLDGDYSNFDVKSLKNG